MEAPLEEVNLEILAELAALVVDAQTPELRLQRIEEAFRYILDFPAFLMRHGHVAHVFRQYALTLGPQELTELRDEMLRLTEFVSEFDYEGEL